MVFLGLLFPELNIPDIIQAENYSSIPVTRTCDYIFVFPSGSLYVGLSMEVLLQEVDDSSFHVSARGGAVDSFHSPQQQVILQSTSTDTKRAQWNA